MQAARGSISRSTTRRGLSSQPLFGSFTRRRSTLLIILEVFVCLDTFGASPLTENTHVILRGLWGVIGKVPAGSQHRPRLQGLRNTLYSSGAYYCLPGLLMFGGSFSGEYVLQAMIQPRTGFNRRGVFLEMKEINK